MSLEIRRLGPADQGAMEAFLAPRLDASIFLVSNSRRAGLVDRGGRYEGTYVAAFDDGEMVGVAALYWIGSLVMQAPVPLIGGLVTRLADEGPREVKGLLGPGEQVARALEVVDWDAGTAHFDEREGLYRLDLDALVVPAALASGAVSGRRIEARDLDLVTAWRVAYHLEALGTGDTPEMREKCRSDMESSLERGDSWLLEDGDRAVASTSFNAALAEVVQVGGVWTPPEHRGRGYARAVVAVSLLDARAEGVSRAVLFTGDDNVPAIRAYAALGFSAFGDYRVVLRH